AAHVGGRATEALELGVRWAAWIARRGVSALRIRLPDFDHGVIDRHAVAVGDLAFDTDFVPGNVRRNQIVADRFLPAVSAIGVPLAAALRREAIGEERPHRLRRRYALVGFLCLVFPRHD